MIARITLYATLLTIAVGGDAFAQASSVALATPDGATALVPTRPLEVLDSDYPLESLIANEEGETVLNLILNETGGVRVAQILSSSGSSALDGVAANIARMRWAFAAQGVSEVRVAITWKLPLNPRDEYAMDAPGPARTSIVVSPKLKSGLSASNYPTISVRLREEGAVIVKIHINETGTVSDPQVVGSSGSRRLDEAAIRQAERLTYYPATVDGIRTAISYTTFIGFFLRESRQSPTPLFCHDQPVFSMYERNVPPARGRPEGFTEWLLFGDDSQVSDVLLLTRNGWLHVAKTALSQMRLPSRYRLVRTRPSNQRPCWVYFTGENPG
jgi:TonB family protein